MEFNTNKGVSTEHLGHGAGPVIAKADGSGIVALVAADSVSVEVHGVQVTRRGLRSE